MEDETQFLDLKIIHWEYFKTPESITRIETLMKPKRVVIPDTKITKGLLLKFTVKWFKNDFLSLNCIAEEVCINKGIKYFTNQQMLKLLEIVYAHFATAFKKKYEEHALGIEWTFSPKLQDAIEILENLHQYE